MNLTREEKDRVIMVLKKAKPFVERGRTVCLSIWRAGGCHATNDLAQQYVMQQIPLPHAFVTRWLYQEHNIVLTDEQAAEYRSQWIDHMIKELKK